MGFRRTVSFLFFLSVLLTIPVGLARNVVLGEYYYPKGGNRWIDRGTKTEFQKGDTIIVKDDRVTLGRGSVLGSIPYQLDDANVQITKGSVRLEPAEQIDASVFGASGGRDLAINDSWALHVLISASSGFIGATFRYYDPDKFGLTDHPVPFEIASASNLATIVPSTTPDPTPGGLAVLSSTDSVAPNGSFTLSGNLDAISYIFQQTTTSGLTGKATVLSQGGGISFDPTTGTVAVTGSPLINGGASVTFKAPDILGNAAQGTLTFSVQATLVGGSKSSIVNKTINVVRDGPPAGSPGGTPVGTAVGGNKPADGFFSTDNPTQAKVNTPFTLSAFARDQDATAAGGGIDPSICSTCGAGTVSITGTWERTDGSAPLKTTTVSDTVNLYKLFSVTITEATGGNKTYRFTAKDALGVGNSYETTVSVSGLSIQTTPASLSTANVGDTVSIAATPTGGVAPYRYSWSAVIAGSTDPTTGSQSSFSFVVPPSAAGKKIKVSLTVTDSTSSTVNTGQASWELTIPIPPLKILSVSPTLPTTAVVGTTIQLSALPSGGVPPYFYSWTATAPGVQIPAGSQAAFSFAVPQTAAGKTITITLDVTDSVSTKVSWPSKEILVPAFIALSFPQVREIPPAVSLKTDSDIENFYGVTPPKFASAAAILNSTDESGVTNDLTVTALDGDGKTINEYHDSLQIDLKSAPLRVLIDNVVPPSALERTKTVKFGSNTSSLSGMGFITDAESSMDALDLNGKSGPDMILPYFFLPTREKYGIVTVQNTSTEPLDIQATFNFADGRTLSGVPGTFRLLPGVSKAIEVLNYFNPNAGGYVSVKALLTPGSPDKSISVAGVYGDGADIFTVAGVRRGDDFNATLFAPLVLLSQKDGWDTTISLLSSATQTVNVQVLNSALGQASKAVSLRTGINEFSLSTLFGKNVDIPFTALKISVASVNGTIAGSAMVRNANGAKALWPLVDSTPVTRAVYPDILLTPAPVYQSGIALTNRGTGPLSLKVRGVLRVIAKDGSESRATVQGAIPSIPAGVTLVKNVIELGLTGVSPDAVVSGGVLVIEPDKTSVTAVDLLATAVLYHINANSAIGVDALSVIPLVK